MSGGYVGSTNNIITWLLNQDKEKVFEIKEYSKKRSLNANSYCWVLINKLSEVLNIPNLEIYKQYIKDLGICRQVEINEEAANTFITAWGLNGMGWICEKLDNAKNKGFVLINAFFGSSTYNSKQMARLINNIVEDCKLQDIPTLDDVKLKQLVGSWEGFNEKHNAK